MRPLFYRWFVQYNPIYLLSATLVLGGTFLLSRGLVDHDGVLAPLGVALVAEVYAAALIGGAALLTRIRQKRAAVMLAMLVVLYQWDTTLHTETSAYLGQTLGVGGLASVAWLAIFVGKIKALAWALRIRFERRAVIAACVAGVGLALGPHLLPRLGGLGSGVFVAAWAFALGSLYVPDGIVSREPLDDWGRVVLARATRIAWMISGALVVVHVAMWSSDHTIVLGAALPVIPLLLLRRVRSEARTWLVALTTLLAVGVVMPGALFAIAALVAVALAVRAFSPRFVAEPAPAAEGVEMPDGPYRVGGGVIAAASSMPTEPPAFAILSPGERARALVGATFSLYLAIWTVRWSGGPWPPHLLALDVAIGLAAAAWIWKGRQKSASVPLAFTYIHAALEANLVPAPHSSLEWGASAVALGFVLLGGALAVSYRLGRTGSA